MLASEMTNRQLIDNAMLLLPPYLGEGEIDRSVAYIKTWLEELQYRLQQPDPNYPALLARCKTALQFASEHLTEMAKCPIYHPVGKCPVLDSINAALADLEKAGVK